MTLTTKIHSLVLMNVISSNQPVYFSQTFIRWCTETTTTLNGKISTCKIRSYSQRQRKPLKRRKKESDQKYNESQKN